MKRISFHRSVQRDVDSAIRYYRKESISLANDFWVRLQAGLENIQEFPELHHRDSSGYQRLNLKRFPYHILYEELDDRIRVVVVRHDKRKSTFGTRRRWS